jgi:hypothetical protein
MTDLKDILGEQLNSVFQSLLDGARGDIQNFANEIATDAILVMQEPDAVTRGELLNSLRNQMVMIAELNRIRANNAMWDAAGRVVMAAVHIGMASVGVNPTSSEE